MSRISHADMANQLAALAWSKETWLRDHGSKRAEWEVVLKRRELEALQQAATDYRKAAQRDAA